MPRFAPVVLVLAALAAGCRANPKTGAFSAIALATVDGSESVALKSCPTKQCLAVYVAPWCGYCRKATPLIKELRHVLRAQGMESWVIVGQDEPGAIREYAREFGKGALLDTERAINPGGVPHFYVVEQGGAVLRQVAGLPPNPADLLAFALEAK